MINYLTIDGGNTLTKYALFNEKGEVVERAFADCAPLISKRGLTPENTLVAMVDVARPRKSLDGFKSYEVKDHFKNGKFLDMPVDYSETLGLDRLVLAYNFYDGAKTRPAALVDSGTFTTVDLIDSSGFLGGHILPGLEFLFDAYDFGHNLKALRPDTLAKTVPTLPKDSKSAIESGISRCFVSPVLSILREWKFEELFITGGNGKLLRERLKEEDLQRPASIHFGQDLLHQGLLKFLLKVEN